MMTFPKWPSWRFGPDGQSAVFESEADVPAGWVDHPTKVKGAAPPAKAKSADKAESKPKVAPAAKRAGRPSKAAKAAAAAAAAKPLDL